MIRMVLLLVVLLSSCGPRKSEPEPPGKTELAAQFALTHNLNPYTCDKGTTILDCVHRTPEGNFVEWHCTREGCLLGKWK